VANVVSAPACREVGHGSESLPLGTTLGNSSEDEKSGPPFNSAFQVGALRILNKNKKKYYKKDYYNCCFLGTDARTRESPPPPPHGRGLVVRSLFGFKAQP
jgi:hypothetical protein